MARPGGFETAEQQQQQQQQVLSRQQERHYRLLAELQALVKALPSACQQRLSYTTLSELALALLDGTVFEIVQGLLEIQHLTEKNLYSQRRQLHSEHRGTAPPSGAEAGALPPAQGGPAVLQAPQPATAPCSPAA
ncbi:hypothetical protein Nmel_015673 [Mimus melanotis]